MKINNHNKKLLKYIAVVSIVLGICFMSAAAFMGESLLGNSYGFRIHGLHIGINTGDFDDDYGFAFMSEDPSDVLDHSFGFETLDTLEIEVGVGTIEFKSGDDYKIELRNIPKNYQHIVNTDTTSEIKIDSPKHYSSKQDYKIIVTLPDDHHLTSLDLSSDVGDIKTLDLYADVIDISSDTGNIETGIVKGQIVDISTDVGSILVRELNAENNSDVSSDTGKVTILKASGGLLEFSGDTGKLELTMDSFHKCTIESSTGSVDLKLKGKKEDYSYTLETDAGRIKFGDETFGMDTDTQIKGGSTQVDISSDVGSVNVSFYE